MGEAGGKRVQDFFDIEDTVKNIKGIYEELLTPGREALTP
jgi:hypothetical protein